MFIKNLNFEVLTKTALTVLLFAGVILHSPDKSIKTIFIGMIIAWTSYLILYTINPKLIQPKIIQTVWGKGYRLG